MRPPSGDAVSTRRAAAAMEWAPHSHAALRGVGACYMPGVRSHPWFISFIHSITHNGKHDEMGRKTGKDILLHQRSVNVTIGCREAMADARCRCRWRRCRSRRCRYAGLSGGRPFQRFERRVGELGGRRVLSPACRTQKEMPELQRPYCWQPVECREEYKRAVRVVKK